MRFAGSASWVALLALALVQGCGYRVAGRGSQLPAGIQTIAVPVLVNRTSEYRIEQRFTNAVVREFLARTKYRVVATPDSADAVLLGEITNINGTAVVFDSASGRATTVLVTVNLKISLQEKATGKIQYRNDNLLFREPYQISTDIPSFFQEESPALDRMSGDVAARVVSDVLENF